jgi:hypothetical protein
MLSTEAIQHRENVATIVTLLRHLASAKRTITVFCGVKKEREKRCIQEASLKRSLIK